VLSGVSSGCGSEHVAWEWGCQEDCPEHVPEWIGMAVLTFGNGVKSCQSYARVIIICNYASTHVFVTVCSQVLVVISEEIAVPMAKGCFDVGLIEKGLRC
jgi:hypothetical protein